MIFAFQFACQSETAGQTIGHQLSKEKKTVQENYCCRNIPLDSPYSRWRHLGIWRVTRYETEEGGILDNRVDIIR